MSERELTPELLRRMFSPTELPAEDKPEVPPVESEQSGPESGSEAPARDEQAIPDDHPNRGELAALRAHTVEQRRACNARLVGLLHPNEAKNEGED